jgi:hypothetical protein
VKAVHTIASILIVALGLLHCGFTFHDYNGLSYEAAWFLAGREEADQFQVWMRKAGTEDWLLAATATGKSVDVTYVATESGPATLEVYIQLRKGNANYGQPSDIALVTVNP